MFPSPANGPPINNGPMNNGPPINNGPLGLKGLRGGGFKSNTLGTTTVPDNYVSNMAQISISTNKVCTDSVAVKILPCCEIDPLQK